MSASDDKHAGLLDELLAANQLTDSAEVVGDDMVRFRFGSATVVAAIGGESLVIKAPMFKRVPAERTDEFLRHLLSLNVRMGGLAAFGITEDGKVSLLAGRALSGIDATEFRTILETVGRFADAFDDLLHDDYFADQEQEQT